MVVRADSKFHLTLLGKVKTAKIGEFAVAPDVIPGEAVYPLHVFVARSMIPYTADMSGVLLDWCEWDEFVARRQEREEFLLEVQKIIKRENAALVATIQANELMMEKAMIELKRAIYNAPINRLVRAAENLLRAAWWGITLPFRVIWWLITLPFMLVWSIVRFVWYAFNPDYLSLIMPWYLLPLCAHCVGSRFGYMLRGWGAEIRTWPAQFKIYFSREDSARRKKQRAARK